MIPLARRLFLFCAAAAATTCSVLLLLLPLSLSLSFYNLSSQQQQLSVSLSVFRPYAHNTTDTAYDYGPLPQLFPGASSSPEFSLSFGGRSVSVCVSPLTDLQRLETLCLKRGFVVLDTHTPPLQTSWLSDTLSSMASDSDSLTHRFPIKIHSQIMIRRVSRDGERVND